jgi:hypothetical protein
VLYETTTRPWWYEKVDQDGGQARMAQEDEKAEQEASWKESDQKGSQNQKAHEETQEENSWKKEALQEEARFADARSIGSNLRCER